MSDSYFENFSRRNAKLSAQSAKATLLAAMEREIFIPVSLMPALDNILDSIVSQEILEAHRGEPYESLVELLRESVTECYIDTLEEKQVIAYYSGDRQPE